MSWFEADEPLAEDPVGPVMLVVEANLLHHRNTLAISYIETKIGAGGNGRSHSVEQVGSFQDCEGFVFYSPKLQEVLEAVSVLYRNDNHPSPPLFAV